MAEGAKHNHSAGDHDAPQLGKQGTLAEAEEEHRGERSPGKIVAAAHATDQGFDRHPVMSGASRGQRERIGESVHSQHAVARLCEEDALARAAGPEVEHGSGAGVRQRAEVPAELGVDVPERAVRRSGAERVPGELAVEPPSRPSEFGAPRSDRWRSLAHHHDGSPTSRHEERRRSTEVVDGKPRRARQGGLGRASLLQPAHIEEEATMASTPARTHHRIELGSVERAGWAVR